MRGQGSPQCSALFWASIFTTSSVRLPIHKFYKVQITMCPRCSEPEDIETFTSAGYNVAFPRMVECKVQCTSRPRCSTWEWWWGSRVPARVDGNMQQRQVGREAAPQDNCKSKLAEIRLTVQQKVKPANKKKGCLCFAQKDYTLGVNRTENMI